VFLHTKTKLIRERRGTVVVVTEWPIDQRRDKQFVFLHNIIRTLGFMILANFYHR
jgi:hypothetical protein